MHMPMPCSEHTANGRRFVGGGGVLDLFPGSFVTLETSWIERAQSHVDEQITIKCNPVSVCV